MRRFAVLILAALFALTALPTVSHAGPWTLKKGKIWSETYGRISQAKYCYDPNGDLSRWNNGGKSFIYDIEQKFEYGATDKFNLLVGIPYSWSFWTDDYITHNPSNSQHLKNEGFKQPSVGVKYRFLDKPLTAAAQVKVYIYPGEDESKQPMLDQWGNAVEPRLLCGKSFTIKKRPCYWALEGGYRIYMKRWGADGDWANAFPVFGEAGFSPHNRVMIKTEIDCYISQPGTGRIKDTYTWRIGPIISILGTGFSSIKRGGEGSLNLELQYGYCFAGRGDETIRNNATWPNSDDRVSAPQELIAKVQALF